MGGVGSVGACVRGWHGSNFGVGGVDLLNFGVGQEMAWVTWVEILAWVAWVHKILAWVKKMAWVLWVEILA